jgi:methylthioribose-1-phosphate isomerase
MNPVFDPASPDYLKKMKQNATFCNKPPPCAFCDRFSPYPLDSSDVTRAQFVADFENHFHPPASATSVAMSFRFPKTPTPSAFDCRPPNHYWWIPKESPMRVNGVPTRTIWPEPGPAVGIIDQTHLPHALVKLSLRTPQEIAEAIKTMRVRGAPLIGATAAYGMALAAQIDPSDASLHEAHQLLLATRPTAVNLRWALDRCLQNLTPLKLPDRAKAAWRMAEEICDEDVAINQSIGKHGLPLLKARQRGDQPIQILTHCNAGWLATVDIGTATAPIYAAHDAGIKVHVWVDETRPRNQGASLTAWELGQHGVPHTVIADNTGGHLMQHGQVDLCIVGTDRTASNGDVANKIGTYLKALAARDNGVPFYVALPSPSIDWNLGDGKQIPIEERDATEVTHISGMTRDGKIATVRLTPESSPAGNWGFDVTPARLVTGLITERGVCAASCEGLTKLFPEKRESTHA